MPARSVRIHELPPDRFEDWRDYVGRHPEATVFHELPWKRAVERTFGHRSWYLLATRDGRVVGVLPLFQINSVVAGRLLVSVPYATYGGLLSDDAEAAGALLGKAKAIAAEVRARCLELRSIRATSDAMPVRSGHATFRRPLPADPAAIEPMLPRKARAAARRAAVRHALSVSFNPEDLDTCWRLYARSMRRLGSPNYPQRFFRELAAAVGPAGHVVQIVRLGDRPVAGLFTLLHRGTVMPYFAGVDERIDIYGLNHYLYAESMRWGAAHGFATYDFGRSRIDNAGAYNFKRLCGFEPRPLEYQTYVVPGRTAPQLTPTAPRWSAARSVWKRLPLPVTRPLGAWLAKSIPG